jgi:mannose-6-phosphate isomerase-like protein (cupin superfamily)
VGEPRRHAEFEELGFQLVVVHPGEPVCLYHGEGVQEDFLVVSGECALVIENEERRLKQWDFVHCPPMTEHVFVGAGDGPCAIVMVGARVWKERDENLI